MISQKTTNAEIDELINASIRSKESPLDSVNMEIIRGEGFRSLATSRRSCDISKNEFDSSLQWLDSIFQNYRQFEDVKRIVNIDASLRKCFENDDVPVIRGAKAEATNAIFDALMVEIQKTSIDCKDDILHNMKEARKYLSFIPVMTVHAKEGDKYSDQQRMWQYINENPDKIGIDSVCEILNIPSEYVEFDKYSGYSVEGDVNIPRFLNMKKLPIKFNRIAGNLSCELIGLTSFENFPCNIGGDLDISYNSKLNSLKGLSKVNVLGKVYAVNTLTFTFSFRVPKNIRDKICWKF